MTRATTATAHADLIGPRSLTLPRSCRRAVQHVVDDPPVSPDLTMETNRSLKTFGCLTIAADREDPCSMSSRHSPRTRASSLLLVWSARIARARRIGSPELIIVANCRENTDSSLSLTFFLVRSTLNPRPCLPTSSGVRPCSRSRCRTSASLSATRVPLMRFPPRSRTLYAYVSGIAYLTSRPSRPTFRTTRSPTSWRRRRRGLSHRRSTRKAHRRIRPSAGAPRGRGTVRTPSAG